MIVKQLTILLFCLSVFLGCGVSASDDTERTYPEAFNFETVSTQELLNNIEYPDSVNVDVFVFDTFHCPPDAICIAPDGIYASESFPPSDTLFIPASETKQFKLTKKYKISLSVTKRETLERPDLRLLGYSLIK